MSAGRRNGCPAVHACVSRASAGIFRSSSRGKAEHSAAFVRLLRPSGGFRTQFFLTNGGVLPQISEVAKRTVSRVVRSVLGITRHGKTATIRTPMKALQFFAKVTKGFQHVLKGEGRPQQTIDTGVLKRIEDKTVCFDRSADIDVRKFLHSDNAAVCGAKERLEQSIMQISRANLISIFIRNEMKPKIIVALLYIFDLRKG